MRSSKAHNGRRMNTAHNDMSREPDGCMSERNTFVTRDAHKRDQSIATTLLRPHSRRICTGRRSQFDSVHALLGPNSSRQDSRDLLEHLVHAVTRLAAYFEDFANEVLALADLVLRVERLN